MHIVSPSVYPGTVYRKSKGDKHRFGDLDHVLAGADGLGDGGESSKGLSNFLPALRLNIPRSFSLVWLKQTQPEWLSFFLSRVLRFGYEIFPGSSF